jgi:hypothetical protein
MRWLVLLSLVLASCTSAPREAVQMTSIAADQPLAKEKSLDAALRLDIGSVEIFGAKDSGSLYSYNLEYDKSGNQPDVRYETSQGGESGRLSFQMGDSKHVTLKANIESNRLRVRFNNSVPLKLQLNMGIGESRLGLSGLKLSGLDVESGVGGAKLSAYEPNPIECGSIRLKAGVGGVDAVGLGNLHFRELDFEGGIGGANLDFSGDWQKDAVVRIQVGVGGVNAKMPQDIGVRVEAEQHFLSGLHLEGFQKRDDAHYSENYDQARFHVSIKVTTGVGGFRIAWI